MPHTVFGMHFALKALAPVIVPTKVGGLVAFVIGASMLVDTDVPAYQISWGVIGTMAAISGVTIPASASGTARTL